MYGGQLIVLYRGDIMSRFIIKFILSLWKSQKARMFMVFCGMTLCSFFVLGFFYFSAQGSADKEELLENYFYTTLCYDDVDDLEDVTNILQSQAGITNIELLAWFEDGLGGAVPKDVPRDEVLQYFHEDLIIAAYVPYPKLESNQIDYGSSLVDGETDKIMVTYAGASGHQAPTEPGSEVEVLGHTYQVSGYYNYYKYDYILPASEFLLLCDEYNGQFQLRFWYDTSISYPQVKRLVKEIESIKPSVFYVCEEPDIPIWWDAVWNESKTTIFSMIISILNYMFVYQFMIKNRLRQYRVLKLLGVTSNRLQRIMFFELLVLYSISFIVSYGMLLGYSWYKDLLIYDMFEVCAYSYISVLVMSMIIFALLTRRFVKKSPFASYQEM